MALKDQFEVLDERFTTLSKLFLKVTHMTTVTLQLLHQKNREINLGAEDSAKLHGFLVDDWAKVLLVKKGREKANA